MNGDWGTKLYLIETDMRKLDFNNFTPIIGGLYVFSDKMLKVTSVDGEKFSVMVADNSGAVYNYTDITLDGLKSRLEPSFDAPVKHKKFFQIITVLREGMSVYLYGSAGTGKNVLCQQIAEELGLTFYFANSVQDRFDLLGYGDANGKFVETEFYKAFTQGGLFMLDEMDNSCEDALITLNAALANKYITFPIVGRMEAHKDFKVIAAGNTCGKGANELYTGRRPLDASTLNRFEFIEVGYDKRIEMQIARGDSELVDFVHDLRKSSKRSGYPLVVSYRNINSIIKLKSKFSMRDCLQMCLLKGMSKDEMGVLHRGLQNKRNRFAEILDDMYSEWDDED